MRTLQLLITTCSLQISWHDMNFKLTLRIHFEKWNWSMILSTWSRDFFWKHILVSKLYTVLLPNLFRPYVSFIAGGKFGICSKKLDVIYKCHLSRKSYLQCKFPTDTMSWNLYIVCINEYLRSCACADVSDFKYWDVKTFLLRLGSELQNLVKKFQSVMKI